MEDRSRERDNLNQAIEAIPEVEKAAYLEALERAPHLVETESDPLCFLQYDNYNCWAAADRLVAYWEERRKIFGPERAFLPLTLVGESALSQEAIECCRADGVLLLPNDKSGRSVVCVDQEYEKHLQASTGALLQCMFYRAFILMRNPQNRKDGNVMIIVSTGGENNSMDQRKVKLFVELQRKAMPVKKHSFHYFSGSDINPILLDIFNKFMAGKNVRIYNCKTPEDRAAALEPFGFTKDRLPKILGGSWELVQWDGLCFQNDRQQETVGRSSEVSPYRDNDVLLGRGVRYKKHPGNQRLLELVRHNIDRYQKAERKLEIKAIKVEVLHSIHEEGGRILEIDKDSDEWKEVCESYALEKIGHSFRNSIWRQNKKLSKNKPPAQKT